MSGAEADGMPTTLKTAAESYLRAKALSRATRNEYLSTFRKWEKWGGGIPIEQLRRNDIRKFLDWVYEKGDTKKGTGTANGPRSQSPFSRQTHRGRGGESVPFFSDC
jgi:hypothetical protein